MQRVGGARGGALEAAARAARQLFLSSLSSLVSRLSRLSRLSLSLVVSTGGEAAP